MGVDVMDDAALDALVRRADAWLKAPLDGPTATLCSLVDALQALRLELARQEQHVESARAIARARREADTATIETLRADLDEARRLVRTALALGDDDRHVDLIRQLYMDLVNLLAPSVAEEQPESFGHPITGGET